MKKDKLTTYVYFRSGEGLKALIDLPTNQAEMDKYTLMHTVPATPQVRGIPPDVISGKFSSVLFVKLSRYEYCKG